ncbi:DUF3300 domain-containing protein [Shewanella sp. C32]|uniref:DUF3300 domain-containing protein n=1 Tax=Shewanella electrica TaxID=515560 RepID=A0ABT2FFM8_9GAMM|nr:DUF3300 domain-containing protein [Shewanella electrica]MCH1925272.1 DUF3300 domain-containing protein [Shewanella electrica]MCS4555097.1 DUF3300 domain-containing protein [Shewanella electrica]
MNTVFNDQRGHYLAQLVLLIALIFSISSISYAADGNDTAYSDAEVAQLMSPIALYPDSLLSHVLIAASYPLEVVQAQRWRAKRGDWDNDKLTDEGAKQGWDPSVVALLAFPDVLDKMSQDLDWTAKVGEAFVADEGQVMDSIQQLRQAAYKAGNLSDAQNIKVENSNERIVIVPSNPTVVYVPYYDTRYVYGDWYWGAYPPVYWRPFPGYIAATHSPFYWRHHGVSISFNFFFGHMFWHDRTVWVDYRHRYTRYTPVRRSHSYEGQRWHHRPEHRRGIHYRSATLNKRYEPKLHRPAQRDYRHVNDAMKNHHLRDTRHLEGQRHDARAKAVEFKRERDQRQPQHTVHSTNGDRKADKPVRQFNSHTGVNGNDNTRRITTERQFNSHSGVNNNANTRHITTERQPNNRPTPAPQRLQRETNVPKPQPQQRMQRDLRSQHAQRPERAQRERAPQQMHQPQRRVEQRSSPTPQRGNNQVRRHEN